MESARATKQTDNRIQNTSPCCPIGQAGFVWRFLQSGCGGCLSLRWHSSAQNAGQAQSVFAGAVLGDVIACIGVTPDA